MDGTFYSGTIFMNHFPSGTSNPSAALKNPDFHEQFIK